MGQIVVLLRSAPGPKIDPITAPRRQVRFLSAKKPRVHNRLSAATGSLEQRTVRRDRVCGHRGLPVVRRDERVVLHVNKE